MAVTLRSSELAARARRASPEEVRFRTFGLRNLDAVPGLDRLDDARVHAIRVVGSVLPFKTNSYVCEELIDWDAVPDDPIFQLTFPQPGMLASEHFDAISRLVHAGATNDEIEAAAREIRRQLNPHPAGQVRLNVPRLDGEPLPGMQHKYRETVLFFPSQGQTCHAYCTYCFRWPQFVETDELRFASREANELVAYLRTHLDVTDVLVTGGDPLIMRTPVLRRYVEPLLTDEFAHVNVRIGTKAPAYWPYRFTHGRDADELLWLLEELTAKGRHVALMAHFSHPRELSTAVAQDALDRVVSTGAVVRCQAPLIRHVNDDVGALAALWRAEVHHGAVPYYMFVERDTGARRYFEVPLARALELYTRAFQQVSGLARTVRGPVMSAEPGKVLVDGTAVVAGERVFVLKMLQARDASRANGVFFARFDPEATWFDQLRPALGSDPAWFPHVAGAGTTGR